MVVEFLENGSSSRRNMGQGRQIIKKRLFLPKRGKGCTTPNGVV
jgi:hypothetical protein